MNRTLTAAGLAIAILSLGTFLAISWHAMDERAAWRNERDACNSDPCRQALPPAPQLPPTAYLAAFGILAGILAFVTGMALGPRQTPPQRRRDPEPMDTAQAKRWLLRASWLFLAYGILARLATPWFMDVGSDGGSYTALAHAIQQTGSMHLPWGDVWTGGPTPPQSSHHYPPLYPLALAGFYKTLGFGIWQTQTASITLSLAALGVVYACTRNLQGHTAAIAVTGLVAVQGRLIWVTGAGFSENLTLALWTLTLWAVVRAVTTHPWSLTLAGLFATLTYLARASAGPFFILAGGAGLAWRWRYDRWRILSPPYLAGAAVFGVGYGAWTLRNHLVTGSWDASAYSTHAQDYAFAHPGILLEATAYKAVFFIGLLALYAVWAWPEMRTAARNWRTQTDSCLILAAALTFILGIAMAAIYTAGEAYPIWWMDNERYAIIAVVPLFWLIFRHAQHTPRFTKRFIAAGTIFLVLGAGVVAQTGTFADSQATARLPLEPGQQVGFEGKIAKYDAYAYLPTLNGTEVYACRATPQDACPGSSPNFILSTYPASPHPGYHAIATITRSETTVTTYARN